MEKGLKMGFHPFNPKKRVDKMGYNERLIKGQWLGMAFYTIICLVMVGKAWGGNCSLKEEINGQIKYYGTYEHPMPISLLGACSDIGAYGYRTWTSGAICVSVNFNGWFNCGNSDNNGDYKKTWSDGSCNLPYGPYLRGIHETWTKRIGINPATYDYDCDGVPDAEDEFPGQYQEPDADNDGVPDDIDPWPNDPTKPGTIQYELFLTKTKDGETMQVWRDKNDPHNQEKWVTLFSSSGLTEEDFEDARLEVWVNGPVHEFMNIPGVSERTVYPDTGSKGISEPITSGGDKQGSSTGSGSGGSSGSADYSQGSTDDYKMIGDYLAGIQRNTKETASNTSAIEDVLRDILRNQALQKASEAFEIKVEGTDLSETNALLGDIKEKIPSLESNDLEDGDTSGMEDNSDLEGEAIDNLYESEKEDLESFMDNIIFQENPILSTIFGSGVTSEGGVSSLSVSAGDLSFSLNFGGMESILNTMGLFFVGFCGLAGLVDFLRG